jgi:glutathione peroxidase
MTIDRRNLLTLLAAGIALPAIAQPSAANGAAMSAITAYAFSFDGLQGEPIRLSDFAGKPMLVVNTASLCGYTPQYTGLEQLYKRFHDRGLVMIGVPSNDFGGQEPGGVAEIVETANHEYGVTFPLAAKADVVGPNAHPFYK